MKTQKNSTAEEYLTFLESLLTKRPESGPYIHPAALSKKSQTSFKHFVKLVRKQVATSVTIN